MKPLVTSLLDSTTIGHFFATRLTRRGNEDTPSEVMFKKTSLEEHHRLMMKDQVEHICRNYDQQEMAILVRDMLFPNIDPMNAPILNHGIVRLMVRSLFLPRCRTTDNRFMVAITQLKSISAGILFEFHPLRPVFVMLKQENFWTRYVEKRVDIALRRTRTNIMATDILEARINASGITFDALRALTSRTPLIKRAYPVINFVTSCVQEFFPMEVFLHAGHQHSESVNFNLEQESLRNEQMVHYNSRVFMANYNMFTGMVNPEVTLFRAFNRRDHINHLAEIHSRTFYDVRFMITIDFDVFGKLAKITAPKNT